MVYSTEVQHQCPLMKDTDQMATTATRGIIFLPVFTAIIFLSFDTAAQLICHNIPFYYSAQHTTCIFRII